MYVLGSRTSSYRVALVLGLPPRRASDPPRVISSSKEIGHNGRLLDRGFLFTSRRTSDTSVRRKRLTVDLRSSDPWQDHGKSDRKLSLSKSEMEYATEYRRNSRNVTRYRPLSALGTGSRLVRFMPSTLSGWNSTGKWWKRRRNKQGRNMPDEEAERKTAPVGVCRPIIFDSPPTSPTGATGQAVSTSFLLSLINIQMRICFLPFLFRSPSGQQMTPSLLSKQCRQMEG